MSSIAVIRSVLMIFSVFYVVFTLVLIFNPELLKKILHAFVGSLVEQTDQPVSEMSVTINWAFHWFIGVVIVMAWLLFESFFKYHLI